MYIVLQIYIYTAVFLMEFIILIFFFDIICFRMSSTFYLHYLTYFFYWFCIVINIIFKLFTLFKNIIRSSTFNKKEFYGQHLEFLYSWQQCIVALHMSNIYTRFAVRSWLGTFSSHEALVLFPFHFPQRRHWLVLSWWLQGKKIPPDQLN